MGRVYRARQSGLERVVALKLLGSEYANDPEFRERFITESRLAASIEHPNILPIYDAGEVDGQLFIAMRYVDGQDLKSVLQRDAPWSLARTAQFIKQAAGALDAAHARGLVHRDIKPANFLLLDGHAYLTDFGIAKETAASRGLTRIGAFIGSLDYASPEQILHEPLDGRSDLYSLGCVFFEALTGVVPFDRPTEHGGHGGSSSRTASFPTALPVGPTESIRRCPSNGSRQAS